MIFTGAADTAALEQDGKLLETFSPVFAGGSRAAHPLPPGRLVRKARWSLPGSRKLQPNPGLPPPSTTTTTSSGQTRSQSPFARLPRLGACPARPAAPPYRCGKRCRPRRRTWGAIRS